MTAAAQTQKVSAKPNLRPFDFRRDLHAVADLVERGNPNALSDVGTAAMLAYAGLRGGAMNVRINIGGIKDADHAAKARERVSRLEVDGEKLREESLRAVSSNAGLQ